MGARQVDQRCQVRVRLTIEPPTCMHGHARPSACPTVLQEIVFIGVGMDRLAIEKMLDECLLSDDEVAVYRQHWVNQADPAFRSPSPGVGPSIVFEGSTSCVTFIYSRRSRLRGGKTFLWRAPTRLMGACALLSPLRTCRLIALGRVRPCEARGEGLEVAIVEACAVCW